MKNYNLLCIVLTVFFFTCGKKKEGALIAKETNGFETLVEKEDTVTVSEVNEDSLFNLSDSLPDNYTNFYYLQSDSVSFQLSLAQKDKGHVYFKLEAKRMDGRNVINGMAELILLEDTDGNMILPEGTFILDNVTNEEYFCDSTFVYTTEGISMSMCFEEGIKKRASLVL